MSQKIVWIIVLAIGMTWKAAAQQPVPPAAPAATTTNRTGSKLSFKSSRLTNTASEENTLRELFHGTVRLLANDQVELTYNFSQPHQLEDFADQMGENAPAPAAAWQIRDGALQKVAPEAAPLFHRSRFFGPVKVTIKGTVTKGNQCATGYASLGADSQLLAGLSGEPMSAYLAQDAKMVADGASAPLTGNSFQFLANFTPADFALTVTGLPALTARRSAAAGNLGQIFLTAPDSLVSISSLQLVGNLDLEWFRTAVDSRLTSGLPGHHGPSAPRYTAPPATEAQLKQILHGFQKLLPDGQVELKYDFSDPAQFAEWQVLDPHGRPDGTAWQLSGPAVRKCQLNSSMLMLQAPLVGPIKLSAQAAVLTGTEAAIGLKDSTGSVRCGFGTGFTGFFYSDDKAKGQNAAVTGISVNQYRALEMTRTGEKINTRFNNTLQLNGTTKRSEPFNVVLAAYNSSAMFSAISVTGFLDENWVADQLRQRGMQRTAPPEK